jgi:hypothetical protein
MVLRYKLTRLSYMLVAGLDTLPLDYSILSSATMTTSTDIPNSEREVLLQKLEEYQAKAAGGKAPAADSSSESDAQLALRLIIESGRYTTPEQIGAAVDEYTKGKPLAYITSKPSSSPAAIGADVRPA